MHTVNFSESSERQSQILQEPVTQRDPPFDYFAQQAGRPLVNLHQTTTQHAPSPIVATPVPSLHSWYTDTNWPPVNAGITGIATNRKKWHDFELSSVTSRDFVKRGIVTEHDSVDLFNSFFSGCDRFVPAFSPVHDTYHSMRSRNKLLFDTVITFGSRARHGPLSQTFQMLHSCLRERICSLVLAPVDSLSAGLEAIQTLLIHACYSDNGWLLTSTAIRIAVDLDLPDSVDNLLVKVMSRQTNGFNAVDEEEGELFRITRIWCALFNLEQILSLDGGRTPSINFTTSPRRLRILCTHPLRTSSDLRLFAQVELNVIRVSAYMSLPASNPNTPELESNDSNVTRTVRGALIDLDLWAAEWNGLMISQNNYYDDLENHNRVLNLQIQHSWALMTLQLRALSASGIHNIAVMTDSQQALIYTAKVAAERHLQLILTRTPSSTDQRGDISRGLPQRSYLASFRYAMDFVHAKVAFSILLVLRLGMLLHDPVERLLERVADAHELLAELELAGGAEVRYSRILALSVQKCERALKELQEQGKELAGIIPEANEAGGSATMRSAGGESTAEQDFTTYVPQEFLFEWAFPGLNLCYVPLNWQDLFVDFSAVF